MAIRVVVVLDKLSCPGWQNGQSTPQSYTCMKQRGVWWVSVSNGVPSRILYVKWQHSEINGFININWFIVPFILQQRFGERSVDHVWNCWIWKRKIRGLPMCIFEIIQESCFFYLVIYWKNSDTCIFGINIEFFLPCRRSHCVQLYIHVSLFLIREDQYQGKKTTYNHWRIALKIKTLQVHHRYFWFFPYVIQITYLINT